MRYSASEKFEIIELVEEIVVKLGPVASLPLQSSLMSKTYLKSDHFDGG